MHIKVNGTTFAEKKSRVFKCLNFTKEKKGKLTYYNANIKNINDS